MRLFKSAVLLLAPLVLVACSSAPTYNPTVFPYELDEEKMQALNIRTVVIPHVNLGGPSRNYLEEVSPRIDGMVSTYLKDNGFKVLPQREFKQHWSTAVRAYGDPVDPTTGKVNMKTYGQIMESVRDQMKKRNLDAFVFTNLIELETNFSDGIKHTAKWDGVTRKPSLQGPGNGVSADFDWSTQLAVASLQVAVFDMELQRVFISRGGMDTTDAIDTRSSAARFVRRRNILENETFVMEGIQLAFHPFIDMERYPGNPD